jgi:activating signal cointegrator complex subunit 2
MLHLTRYTTFDFENMTTATLSPYPSFHARSRLSHSQLASINQKISQSIQQTLALPPHALNSVTPAAFISSYARDVAQHNLDALIWDADPKQAAKKPKSETTEARAIHARTLLLAERLASSTPGALDPTTLLDLSIAYASHPTRLRALFTSAFSNPSSSSTSPLLASTTASALPAFTSVLLSHTTIGLHGLRKTAHAILCLLRVAPAELLRAFALSKDFTLALAQAYDAGLGAASTSYGRLHLPVASAPQQRDLDDWEVLFLQTKADLLDAFHILLTALLNAADPSETEQAFDAISALRALPAPPRRSDDPTRPTPFLNRSLLADYQHAYDLSAALPRALAHGVAADDDARLEWLSGALRELDADLDGGGSGPSAAGRPARRRDPGAFRLLLGSAIGDPGHVEAAPMSEGAAAIPSRGAEAATASGSRVVDLRVEEVRAILPDYEPEYIEALLQRTEYGSVERVVEALLEGTAPPPEAIQRQQRRQQATSKAQKPPARDEFEYTHERRNVFDGEEMDVSKLRIGKKRFFVSFLRVYLLTTL